MRRLLATFACLLVAPSAASAATVDVETRDNFWTPSQPDLTLGDTVRWTFGTSGSTHTVTVVAPGGATVLDRVVEPGDPALNYTAPATGRYSVLCQIHSPMRARFDVEAASEPQAPVASATVSPAPGPGGTHGGPVQLDLAATDDSAVESVAYRVNGGATSIYVAPLRFASEGARTVEYRATDIAGNQDVWRTVAFTIDDATAPLTAAATSSVRPPIQEGGVTTYSGPVDVSLSASDVGGLGVDRTEIGVDGAALKVYDGPVTVRGDGTHSVTYRSIDRAGNVEATGNLNFRIAGPVKGPPPPPPAGFRGTGKQVKLGVPELLGGASIEIGCTRTTKGTAELAPSSEAARKLGLKRGNAIAEGVVKRCKDGEAKVLIAAPRGLRGPLRGLRERLDAKLRLEAGSADGDQRATIAVLVSPG